MSDSEPSENRRSLLHFFEELALASPAAKQALVLSLIAENPLQRLEIPKTDGKRANLDYLDFSRLMPVGSTDPPVENASHVKEETPLVALAGAVLYGATLESANLSGVNLAGADLREAVLRKARLKGANLEQADLACADLAGAELAFASLGKANLQGAMLEDADLRGASLRFAQLAGASLEGANLEGADLWGADLCGAILKNVNLSGANLSDANVERADFTEARLENAVLWRANLRDANLRDADLRGANLRGADLCRATLNGARLQDVDLSTCDLTQACFAGAWLERTQMDINQLQVPTAVELAGNYEEAGKSYLALERNFKSFGDSDAARWPYCKRRRMQKKVALAHAVEEFSRGKWSRASGDLIRYLSDQLVEWLCDYGESIPRVLLSLLMVYLVFMGIYGMTSSVIRIETTQTGPARVVTRDTVDLAIFSLLAMTTSGSPVVGLQPRDEMVHLLTGVQALLGISLTGLLGFVVGNRIRR